MNLGNIPKNIVTFLQEVRLEMKKVSWPTKEQTLRYTLIVLGISIITAVFLGGFDFLFSAALNKFIINR